MPLILYRIAGGQTPNPGDTGPVSLMCMSEETRTPREDWKNVHTLHTGVRSIITQARCIIALKCLIIRIYKK